MDKLVNVDCVKVFFDFVKGKVVVEFFLSLFNFFNFFFYGRCFKKCM